MCPELALFMYFGCFNMSESEESCLFPSNIQHDNFCMLLEKVPCEHQNELGELEYQHGDIGTHSIHNVVTTFVLSLA